MMPTYEDVEQNLEHWYDDHYGDINLCAEDIAAELSDDMGWEDSNGEWHYYTKEQLMPLVIIWIQNFKLKGDQKPIRNLWEDDNDYF